MGIRADLPGITTMSNQEQEYTLSNQNLKASVKCLHPRVGLGVFVTREGRFLIGKRKGFHGSGTWQLPGGNLEFGESFQDCASREVLEETNLIIHNIRYHTTTNDPMPELNSHYVDIFMCAESADINAEPIVMEPDKCDIWNWITWDEFIKDGIDSQTNKYRPMFQPMQSYILQRNGKGPFKDIKN
ncbi:hypothetical protein G9A89_023385 [Geosiphon pyriformis]|nr:hypothetical protein G9A89_023385 [Geosiphon pyriformis]